MSTVTEIINTRSSIRKYKDQPIPEDVFKALIEAGLKAPTAANKQEIHISAVCADKALLQEIQNDLNPNAANHYWYDAPAVLFLSGPDAFKWSAVDAGIAVENIHLAAADMGLGSVILGCMEGVLNGEKKAEYAKKLGFPEGFSFHVAIAVGYPDTEKTPHTFDFENNVTIL